MHWGESVCRGGELKANPSLTNLLPGSLLDPPPSPHASQRLSAEAHAGDRHLSLGLPERAEWRGRALEGGHAGPSRVSGGTKKKARAGGAGPRLSCEGLR